MFLLLLFCVFSRLLSFVRQFFGKRVYLASELESIVRHVIWKMHPVWNSTLRALHFEFHSFDVCFFSSICRQRDLQNKYIRTEKKPL